MDHVEFLRLVADRMRTEHGPWHIRHGMWHAMAALLDEEAANLERHIPAWDGTNWKNRNSLFDPAPKGYENPEWVEQTIQHHYGRVLAVAHAYPSQASDEETQ